MKKILSLVVIAFIAYGCNDSKSSRSSLDDLSVPIDSAAVANKYIVDHLGSGPNRSEEKVNFLNQDKLSGLMQLLVANGVHIAGVGDPITQDNYSLPVDTSELNKMITAFVENPYRFATKSYLIKAQAINDYFAYAKSKNETIVNFRLLNATFKPTGGKDVATMVLVALNAKNQYIIYDNNKAFEHCLPCPDQCPTINADPRQTSISDIIKN